VTAPERGAEDGPGGSLALGRLLGVPVRLHWTVLIIMGLIAWGMAGQSLPAGYPGHPAWVYAVSGVAGAAAFLAGLLAHELAHAVVARRHGVTTRRITLWLFGGVAELAGEAPDAGAELRIAGAGPLVSLLLGGVFAGLAAAVSAAAGPGPVLGVLSWLAGINILLAVFNVLPGAPLDGGRLLRAALWKRRGDRQWAALTAARAGRVLGLALIGIGLLQLVLLRDLTALWLALIGWFVLGAAGQEEQQAILREALTGVRVRDVMSTDPDTVPAGTTVAEFVQERLFRHRHSSFPVTDQGALRGLLTLSRVKAVPPEAWAGTPVEAVAAPMSEVPVAAPAQPLADVLPRMQAAAEHRALVLDDGVLVGIVTLTDVARSVAHHTLRNRSTTSPVAHR
jgi:Zn-dependent protease/CBS domain-containing protein